MAVFKKLGFRIDIGSARGLAVKRAATWRSTCSKEGDRDFNSRSPGPREARGRAKRWPARRPDGHVTR